MLSLIWSVFRKSLIPYICNQVDGFTRMSCHIMRKGTSIVRLSTIHLWAGPDNCANAANGVRRQLSHFAGSNASHQKKISWKKDLHVEEKVVSQVIKSGNSFKNGVIPDTMIIHEGNKPYPVWETLKNSVYDIVQKQGVSSVSKLSLPS